ncbi:MAG: molybdate ABC transporter substrate-binding protein [Actinomycetota bacterium]
MPRLHGSITVFAAASLSGSFTTIARQFEQAHSGVTVVFDFGASSTLATQIDQGAPADVFASAAPKNMDTVVMAGNALAALTFAVNRLEIAVPPANPAHIARLADLAAPRVKVALCQQQVPCGATAQSVFDNAKITVKPVTLEADVKSTLAKVTLGEVDAAVVYVTDVQAAGTKVVGIRIPDDVNASTAYSIARLTGSANPDLAAAFVGYVTSPAGRSVLSAAGFDTPR